MGSYMSSVMDDSMKKNQEFMQKTQANTMERQIQMQNLMRERQMAMQVAMRREMFHWWASFYAIATVGMIAGFKHSRKPAAIAPLLPLTFLVGYQADFAYGTKMQRIKVMADNVLDQEHDLLAIPAGLPTLEEIDNRRSTSK